MKHLKTFAIVGVLTALASPVLAQRSGAGARDGTGPLIDSATLVVVEGTVKEFVAGFGQGAPSLVVADAAQDLHTFILGPFWYLSAQQFVAAPGDLVTVSAYPCQLCETGVAVVKVVNATQGVTLTLRDENGVPLWTHRQAGHGAGGQGSGGASAGQGNGGKGSGGNGNGGNGTGDQGRGAPGGGKGNGGPEGGGLGNCGGLLPDLARTTTFSGSVVSFAAAAGAGPASVTLSTAGGEVTVLLSPAMVLMKAGYTPTPGAELEIVAAPAELNGSEVWLALTLTDVASGLTLVFRDPATGLPVAGARRGRP